MITCEGAKIFVDGVATPMTKVSLKDLIDDAVARGNEEAVQFLVDEDNKKTIRTTKEGKEIEAKQNITAYRPKYLKKYCGYATKTVSTADKKKQKEELFADAFKRIRAAK